MSDLPVRRLYRLVRTHAPTRADFLSNAEQGVTPLRPLTPTQLRVGSGVAGMETLGQARARVTANPQLGAFIAVLDLPDNGQCGIARTGRRAGHHHRLGRCRRAARRSGRCPASGERGGTT